MTFLSDTYDEEALGEYPLPYSKDTAYPRNLLGVRESASPICVDSQTMSVEEQRGPGKCLGVAIDHRIRLKLARPAPEQRSPPYEKALKELVNIEKIFSSISGDVVDPHEFLVTAQLLRWYAIGGVVALLQQPANNHPFAKGEQAVTTESPTLAALREVEQTITGFQGEMSILDSLPFTRAQMHLSDGAKASIRSAVLKILQAKEPRVILCMWQDEIPACGKLVDLKSQGVGKIFDSSRCDFKTGHCCWKISSFHPSYMLRYHPDMSSFRQLFVLEMTQAFAVCAEDWPDEPWMEDLRARCRKEASESGKRRRQKDTKSGDAPRETVVMSLERSLASMGDVIQRLKVGGLVSCAEDRYDKLAQCGLSYLCNDASLCLQWIAEPNRDSRTSGKGGAYAALDAANLLSNFLGRILKMSRPGSRLIRRRNWTTDNSSSNQDTIAGPRQSQSSTTGGPWYGLERLPEMLQQLIKQMNAILKSYCEDKKPENYLHSGSARFLEFAVSFEDLLGDLFEEKRVTKKGENFKERKKTKERKDSVDLQVEELGVKLGCL